MTLDRAHTDENELTRTPCTLLGASTLRVEVREVDLVREMTVVDVRFRIDPDARATATARTEPFATNVLPPVPGERVPA